MNSSKSIKENTERTKEHTNNQRKNTHSTTKGLSYIPKPSKQIEPNQIIETPPLSKSPDLVEDKKQELLYILTKEEMITLFIRKPDQGTVEQTIKTFKDIYSEESLIPEASKVFNLPMDKCIMPPRKQPYPGRPEYAQETAYNKYGTFRTAKPHEENDGDKGIILGSDLAHDSVKNAPLWFDEELPKEDQIEVKDEKKMEKQADLEEEKAKFNAGTSFKSDINEKLDIQKIQSECIFSSVDEKFEEKLKSSKIEQEFFANADGKIIGDIKPENIAAIDATTLEAKMLKGQSNEKGDDKNDEDSDKEIPVWDSFTAEEIQKHTESHMQNWGLTLDQEKVALQHEKQKSEENERYNMFEPANNMPSQFTNYASINERQISPEEAARRNESRNPFCHSSLQINENDRVWYYKDMQNCIQGPFTSIEMYMWNKAGYFPSDLLVQCGNNAEFMSLGSFLSSTVYKPPPDPIQLQHFGPTNMQSFFEAQHFANPREQPRQEIYTSLEEIEKSQFRSDPYSRNPGRNQYPQRPEQWTPYSYYQVPGRYGPSRPQMPMYDYHYPRQYAPPIDQEHTIPEVRNNINALFEGPAFSQK